MVEDDIEVVITWKLSTDKYNSDLGSTTEHLDFNALARAYVLTTKQNLVSNHSFPISS